MTITIDASGIRDLETYFERFPVAARTAMRIAINDTADGPALKAARRDITEQVNFPDGYLDTRLRVEKRATDSDLEAVISGRDRATSLRRFAPIGTPVVRGRANASVGGVSVSVKPGRTRAFPTGFLFGLNNGNIGFAIRVKPGQPVHSVFRRKPIPLFKDVYLLYGPSVDQIFRDVADQITPEVTSALAAEFHRQFARLTGG